MEFEDILKKSVEGRRKRKRLSAELHFSENPVCMICEPVGLDFAGGLKFAS